MKKRNIILIGMPGAGKSSVGVILAKALGYEFIDTDLVIQHREKRLLREIIADEGNGYQWEEKDDKMTSCAIYFRFPETEEATETSYNGQNMGSVLQGLF